jgi:hypothetical protein
MPSEEANHDSFAVGARASTREFVARPLRCFGDKPAKCLMVSGKRVSPTIFAASKRR